MADDACHQQAWHVFRKEMAPKTPKTPQNTARLQARAEWKTCSTCSACFVARDALKHEALCSVVAGGGELSTVEINHGLVLRGKLYGLLSDDQSGCRDCLQLAAKVQASHVILISPSAMQLCEIQIGSYIFAETDMDGNCSSTFLAWPCSHISPSSISINPESMFLTLYETLAIVAVRSKNK